MGDHERNLLRTEMFDMHIHSNHSPDGHAAPKDIVKRAKTLGLGGIAVVDHNTIKGAKEAMEYGDKNIIIIPGMEVSSSTGHIIALGIDQEIPRGLSPRETVEKIHHQGGMAIAPHPYRFWSGLGEEETIAAQFQTIEVTNARSKKSHNNKARKLAKRIGVGMTGGSDAHDIEHIGYAYTIFPSTPTSTDDALQMITKKTTNGEGHNRSSTETIGYVKKSVSEWMCRGMKKM